jgi:hypothetical protein
MFPFMKLRECFVARKRRPAISSAGNKESRNCDTSAQVLFGDSSRSYRSQEHSELEISGLPTTDDDWKPIIPLISPSFEAGYDHHNDEMDQSPEDFDVDLQNAFSDTLVTRRSIDTRGLELSHGIVTKITHNFMSDVASCDEQRQYNCELNEPVQMASNGFHCNALEYSSDFDHMPSACLDLGPTNKLNILQPVPDGPGSCGPAQPQLRITPRTQHKFENRAADAAADPSTFGEYVSGDDPVWEDDLRRWRAANVGAGAIARPGATSRSPPSPISTPPPCPAGIQAQVFFHVRQARFRLAAEAARGNDGA